MKLIVTAVIVGFLFSATGQNQDARLNLNDPEKTTDKPAGKKTDAEFSIDSISALQIQENMVNFDFRYKAPEQRPFYNHTFRYGMGYSLNTTRLDNSMRVYNDTSEHQFQILGHSPMFSFSHTIALDSTFSLGYTFSYAQSEILFDNQYYGSRSAYISLNPQVHIFRRYNFEYYVKLRLALNYEQNNLSMVPSERIRHIFPTGFHMYTGVTLAGLNFLISDHLALNAELSIWSPESVSIGASYRFFRKSPKTNDVGIRFAY